VALMQLTQSGATVSLDKVRTSFALQDLGSHSMQYSWVQALIWFERIRSCGATARFVSKWCRPQPAIIRRFDPACPSSGFNLCILRSCAFLIYYGPIQRYPDIFVRANEVQCHKFLPADQVLKMANIKPIVLAPNEVLVWSWNCTFRSFGKPSFVRDPPARCAFSISHHPPI
jgi:phenylalanine ammonia-lyase